MKVYTVHECSNIISESIMKNYLSRNITVEGVVSSFREHFSGNCYFSLIDDTYRISCKINHMHLRFVKKNLNSGDKVIISGSIVYDKYFGRPLFLVERVLDSVKSSNETEKEKLIKELEVKGYFSKQLNRRMPKYVFNVGIITSKSGAAVHDIIETGRMRNKNVSYFVYNSSVQGEKAAQNMANMVEFANKEGDKPDVLIIARGGGAEEDFRPFNERILLDAVYNSKIPVISAIGHEVDDVLLDKVADYRAATPTQAAELAILEESVLLDRITGQFEELKSRVAIKIKRKKYLFILELFKLNGLIVKISNIDKIRKIFMLIKDLQHKCFIKISSLKTECIDTLIKLQEVYLKHL